jgi:hypothetical protein
MNQEKTVVHSYGSNELATFKRIEVTEEVHHE